MSTKLIARSADLKRLRDDGYEIEVRSSFLVVHSVPYVTPSKAVGRGTIVTDLALNDDVTSTPNDHQVWFAGEHPCSVDAIPIAALGAQPCSQTLCEGLRVDFRFSSKRPGGYPDYHSKVTQYVEILEHPARALRPHDSRVTARTFQPTETTEEESVFLYADSASSRAGIVPATAKLASKRIAVVGLGGTGAYVLDLVAKCPVSEIHLFDGDQFLQHNAFRAPGAASLEDLRAQRSKVAHHAATYSRMRRGVIPHPEFIDGNNVALLAGFDFVFVCVDRPVARKRVLGFLQAQGTPFIDVGMELQLVEETSQIIGTCRLTLSTPQNQEHLSRHVSLQGDVVDDMYASNIQVADMNALNAALAVVKWKKFCDFYQDCYREHQSVYAINAHQLTRDEVANA